MRQSISLVGWWKLDGDAKDSIGSYDGYEHGSPSYSNAKIGQGYDNTSGRSNGIELIRNEDFKEYEDFYSFSLWFKSTSTSGGGSERIISRDASEYPTIVIRQNESSPQNIRFYEATETDTTQVTTNEWHHLAFTIDTGQNESKLYIDGELVGTGGVNDDTSARPYVLGGNTEGDGDISGNHFKGKIDDVRLYDHKLSKKEIKKLSKAKVLHYKFNIAGEADDSSGFGNDGTLNSVTHTDDSKIGAGAYDFASSNGIVASNNSMLQITGNLTISFWAKPFDIDSPSRQNPIHKDYSDEYTMTMETNGDLSFYFNDSDSSYNNYKVSNMFRNDNEWVHVTAVRDMTSGEVRWYRNGSLYDTQGLNGGDPVAGSNNVQIGYGYTNAFNGVLDDFRIYASALSDNEVSKIYEQRASIDDEGNLHSHELKEPNNKFGDWGSWRGDVEVLGAIDGFSEVGKADATSNRSYEDIFTGQFTVGDNPNSGSGNYVYLIFWAKWNNISHWARSGTWVKRPSPEPNNYQQYILKSDGQNGRDEYFRLFYDDDDDTSIGYIADPKVYKEEDYKKLRSLSNEGVYSYDELNEVGPGADSLVGHWKLDGDARDYSGNNNHGTVNGATVTSGLGQSAYSFDGSNSEYISINNGIRDKLNGNTEASLTAWVKIPSNNPSSGDTETGIFCFQGSSSNNTHYPWTNEDIYLSTFRQSRVDNIDDGGFDKTKWHLVSITTKPGSNGWKFYQNGNLKHQTTGESEVSVEESVSIGWNQGSHYWTGKIQDVRVFNRALTQEEVKTLYNLTDPRQDQRVVQSSDGTVYTKGEFSELL